MIPKLKSQAPLSASHKCPWGSSLAYEERFTIVSKECKQIHSLGNNATGALKGEEATDRSYLENLKAAWRTLFNKLDAEPLSPYHNLQQLHHQPHFTVKLSTQARASETAGGGVRAWAGTLTLGSVLLSTTLCCVPPAERKWSNLML